MLAKALLDDLRRLLELQQAELDALRHLNQRIAARERAPVVWEATLRECINLVGADSGFLAELHRDDSLEILASTVDAADCRLGARVKTASSLVARIADGRTLCVALQNLADVETFTHPPQRQGSALLTAVLKGGKGATSKYAICLLHKESHYFTEVHEEVLNNIAVELKVHSTVLAERQIGHHRHERGDLQHGVEANELK